MKNKKSVNQGGLKIGSKVVCINDDFSNMPSLYMIIFQWPVKGRMYTIRDIVTTNNGTSFMLKEIINEVARFPCGAICEISFFNWRFRTISTTNKEVENHEPEYAAGDLLIPAEIIKPAEKINVQPEILTTDLL